MTLAAEQPRRDAASPGSAPPAPARRSLRVRWSEFGRPPRLMGIDVARGLAVFGMIGAHAGIASSFRWTDPVSWTALVEGRSSILFAVVAGISVALATGFGVRPQGEALRSARLRMAGRALAVLAIGLLLELLGTNIAVILPVYGVLFLVVIHFLGLRRRTLLLSAGTIAVVGPVAILTARALALGGAGGGVDFLLSGSYPLTVWLPLMLLGMAVGRSRLSDARTALALVGVGAVLAVTGYGVGTALNGPGSGWVEDGSSASSVPSTAPPSSSARDDGGSGVTGGASGSGSAQACVTGSDGTTTCTPGGGSSLSGSKGPGGATYEMPSYIERLIDDDLGASISSAWAVSPHSGGTFEIIGSGGFALAVIGGCLLVVRRLRPLFVPLAAVGSMPLTAYSAHVVSFAILVGPVGLVPALFAGEREAGFVFWGASMGILLIACTAWALTRGRGPLERVTAWAARRTDGTARPRQ
ncbi:heparan-alpha-glucosaminide N-acetyltransferase domain-containing protein [Microbacterium sp. TNHR37B]|uniref:heparan-alpha-glucosaminide N-acetyltransferase domain-containing protein n=1 Tax=Microbacterium sp. TNHR37B TaxID=1775956 RepID=UPI0007B21672|nr:heparan-alpha-glucosaminide N-acetyltransferase domain-containing protein [Microbacterium sp. TNHR37B]KZE89409.1 hypothetical protein AVP41_02203 [Microbacterium sp. TNHR37B]